MGKYVSLAVGWQMSYFKLRGKQIYDLNCKVCKCLFKPMRLANILIKLCSGHVPFLTREMREYIYCSTKV